MFRELCREYARSIPGIAESLAYQGFEDELQSLPGKYAPPAGTMLLAIARDEAIGCVALRPLADDSRPPNSVCEMKRMYLKPTHRGRGIGRLLGDAIVAEARRLGYLIMRLDTDTQMPEAIGLYTSLGFKPRPPYNADPSPDTLWFEKELG
jgi:GNAT superfamily N-acetyltransferase